MTIFRSFSFMIDLMNKHVFSHHNPDGSTTQLYIDVFLFDKLSRSRDDVIMHTTLLPGSSY